MELSFDEHELCAKAMEIGDRCRKYQLSNHEIFTLLIFNITSPCSLSTIRYVLACIPEGHREGLREYADEMLSAGEPQWPLFFGPGLSEEDRAELRPKYLAAASEIVTLLRELHARPEQRAELRSSITDEDRTRAHILATLDPAGLPCAYPGCPETRRTYSIHCFRHHEEQLKSMRTTGPG